MTKIVDDNRRMELDELLKPPSHEVRADEFSKEVNSLGTNNPRFQIFARNRTKAYTENTHSVIASLPEKEKNPSAQAAIAASIEDLGRKADQDSISKNEAEIDIREDLSLEGLSLENLLRELNALANKHGGAEFVDPISQRIANIRNDRYLRSGGKFKLTVVCYKFES